jgi:hypothetical protein
MQNRFFKKMLENGGGVVVGATYVTALTGLSYMGLSAQDRRAKEMQAANPDCNVVRELMTVPGVGSFWNLQLKPKDMLKQSVPVVKCRR